MKKKKSRNPNFGYAIDLIDLMKKILPITAKKGIKIITNGGGVNPIACADAILEVAMKLDIGKLDVAVVLGDDIKYYLHKIIQKGCELNNMETGEPISKVRNK